MLAQEPWCWEPDRIAKLTDWQILKIYAEPAVERAKQFHKPPGGTGTGQQAATRPHGDGDSTGPPGEPGSPEHRGACIGAYMDIQGLSRERAVQQYEKQLDEWRDMQKRK